jgi:hypothetical protein
LVVFINYILNKYERYWLSCKRIYRT